MKKLQRIVAPTDLSVESLSAVRQAIEIAGAQAASITIVHVPQTPTPLTPKLSIAVDLESLSRKIEETARKTLERWIERNAKDSAATLVVRHGIPHEVICALAAELRADLVVMSTHGRQGIAHFVLGSVTESVLRDAPCPVLVVKPRSRATAKSKAA